MFVIIWEYQVKHERLAEFEKIYGSHGQWVELFRKGTGFLGTELLHDEKYPYRYITLDRWRSAEDYEKFLLQWQTEYLALGEQCEDLTEHENLLGKFESILPLA